METSGRPGEKKTTLRKKTFLRGLFFGGSWRRLRILAGRGFHLKEDDGEEDTV
jgi:hypothetical protein